MKGYLYFPGHCQDTYAIWHFLFGNSIAMVMVQKEKKMLFKKKLL